MIGRDGTQVCKSGRSGSARHFQTYTWACGLRILYINYVVCDVTILLVVLHFLYITTLGWLIVRKCSSKCIHECILMHGKNGRNSRGEFLSTTGQRKVTVRTLVDDRGRYLNALKEWTEFSRRVFADHWTQRKVTVRASVDDRGRYLNARKEWTKFSRRISANYWTQRKVLHFLYITAPGWLIAGKCSSECIHEGILMRGKNGQNSRGEFLPTTGHTKKWRSEHRSTTVGWRAFGEEKNVCSSNKRMGV